MDRRYLPNLLDHRGRPGAFASTWGGWSVNPRGRRYTVVGRKNLAYPPGALDALEERVGIYAILYDSGGGNFYVAYVGSSKWVRTEVRTRYRERDLTEDSYFPLSVIYISNLEITRELESDLIRYYCPPWNVDFG